MEHLDIYLHDLVDWPPDMDGVQRFSKSEA